MKTHTIEENNLQNLFQSIANHETRRGQVYHEILKKDAVNGQQVSYSEAFDTMKKDLWAAKRNAVERKYFHTKMNFDQNGALTKREIHKNDNDKQPFIFPKMKADNVIGAATNLLNSQRTYHTEIKRLFCEICKKNKNHAQIQLLERSIDRFIEMADELIYNTTKSINEHAKNISVSDNFKKKPITYKTSRLLKHYWKYVDDFVYDYGKEFNFDMNPEVDAVRKFVYFAIREIESYQKYLEIVYQETGINRDDATNLSYFEHKKLDEEMENDYY